MRVSREYESSSHMMLPCACVSACVNVTSSDTITCFHQTFTDRYFLAAFERRLSESSLIARVFLVTFTRGIHVSEPLPFHP
jgi:hypothetical protein